jgi:RHS repeat-associated protein
MDALYAKIGSGGVNWMLPDLVGSIRDITNSSGSLIDHRDWDPFGNLTYESSSSNGDRYGYTGREWSTELSLQYNRARWYDPATKRWMSQDPLGFDAGDSNLYRYVSNAPTYMEDPSGLDAWANLLSVVGALVGQGQIPGFGKWDQLLAKQRGDDLVQLNTAIQFFPDAKLVGDIKFIQIVKRQRGVDPVRDKKRRPDLVGRMTEPGWAIDRKPKETQPWAGMPPDGKPQEKQGSTSPDGFSFDPKAGCYTLLDFPGWYKSEEKGMKSAIYFQTYFVSISPDGKTATVIGGIEWKYVSTPGGNIKTPEKGTPIDLSKPKNLDDLKQAIELWNKQAKTNDKQVPIPSLQYRTGP